MEGQKDMEEPAKGKASGENLQTKRGTMRGATRSGGGQSGLILVLVVSFLLSIAISGTGVADTPQLTASPASLSFGNVTVGSSAMQTVTLTNTGSSSVSISQVNVPAGFLTSGLAVTLGAGQTATFSVVFAPTSAGSVTGNSNVVSNASSPVTIPLAGTGGQPNLSVTPSTVSFGNVVVGTASTQSLTLTNSGTANLTVTQATVTGNGFATIGLTLPLTLTPGQNTNFNVAFSATSADGVSGGVSLVSNAPASPTTIAISGTGVAATPQLTASPASLSFGNVTVGSSAMQTVTLTNTGSSSVSISQVNVPAGVLTSGLAVTLGAGQTATFSVVFAPTSSGSVTGNANVVSNASSPVTIPLAGTGGQPTAYWTTSTWDLSTSVVVGYNVYRGTVSGGPYSVLNSTPISATTYTDSTVQSGQTYFYVVTALDSNNDESGYSTEQSVVIPVP